MIAKSLVDVFHSHHKLLHLLKSFLKKEVAACHDPGTLFRSNSVAMKMVVAYGHKTAQHYLQQTLTPLVVELCNSPLPLEVDPIKLPPGEDAETNQRNLRIVSQKFFDRIVASIDQCPKSIAEIVSRKFPNHWKAAVGGFVFLRLFCPACVSPENAGIVSAGRVGITERRALVLVAKCLQNLSNQATFNQPYMENVNDFITDNVQALDEFFTKLAARPAEDHTIDGMMVSEDSLHDGIIYLQQFIDKNPEKVQRTYESSVAKSSIAQTAAKWDTILNSVESSKRAALSAPPISSNHLLNKQRSNSAGGHHSSVKELKNKQRSNSDNNTIPKWSSLTKNLKIAKQTVITPTLNVISNVANKSEEEVKVINIDSEWRSEPRSAHIVVQQLLKTLITICKNNKLSDAQSIKFNGQPLNWALTQQTADFLQFGRDVCELQVVTFDNMSPEYIAAFFINAFNLLVLHLHFLVGPPNSDIRRKSYQMHKYNIAGCLYSLADIQHGVLRNNPKNSLSRVRQIRSGDKRRQFVIPLDPRYHFVLFAVNVTLPCLRIMLAEMLVEDLHRAGEEFCSSKVDICLKKKEISLPKLFSQFGTDFGKSRSEMLKWLFQFLTHTKRTELLDLLEKPSYICLYRSESWNPVTYKTKFILDSLSKSPSLEHQTNYGISDQLVVPLALQLSPDLVNNESSSSANSSPHFSSLPQTPRVVTILEPSAITIQAAAEVNGGGGSTSSPNTPRTEEVKVETSPSLSPTTTNVAATVSPSMDSTQTTPLSSPLTVPNSQVVQPSPSASPVVTANPTSTTTQVVPMMKLSSNSAFDRDRVNRRKSRSLTHGNRLAPTVKKDSTALTLINSLRMSAQSSTKSILSSLNDVVKRIAESIDIKYVSGVLAILKRATRQLSFNEWQKSATMSGGSGAQDKPSLAIKPQVQLFSNHQVHCLTPTSLSGYAPTFQELYALTLSIEKETIKFLDFMDIASFSQSNDISELLADVSDQISNSLRDHDSLYDPLSSVKETLESTVIYFINTVTTKLHNNDTNHNNNNHVQLNQQQPNNNNNNNNGINIPLRGSGVIDVDIKLVTVLYELILDGKQLPTAAGKRDNTVISKLQELSSNIQKVNNMAELSPIMSKIERIGRMISIIEEQANNNNRFSPRQSPR
ncbi:Ras GTPase activation domain-containing protein [Cavenderia fasciculata]|uniref:Ras GTPase activation domain-containing protein n=1 Tax=Cavenderia fasciculata TaxID=261658 RepID=F4PGB9_CACFS|nr:Ras GTPase activation domain-containing protein [Cavenderia fasciculata]EGG24753.1 Ras GTPase activation domain-containing protein [Cavenderia fasciculata]|eukprot:XP_004362604.1 Ras GTPase activation domain-containing protein [Cavenderia fasciculata]